MTTIAERDFVSVGQLAFRTQKPVRKIEQAAAHLKIQPAMRLNAVPYFNGDQVDRLTAFLSNPSNKGAK